MTQSSQAPIVSNGLVAGAFPDFVINYDVDMNPSVEGRTLLTGKQIRITMPPEFTVSGPPIAQDPFDSSNPFGEKSWAALLQGWPQVPIFSSFPPGDLSGDIRYTISMSGTHTMIVTANQDLDGSLSFVPPSPAGPGIKQIHILFAHLVNPAAGSYQVQVESETGPNGALEVGTGTIEIADEQDPAIAFTSVFNEPFRKNGIYQTVQTGDFLENSLHLFAWNSGGDPLSGAYLEYTGDTTADILIDVPAEPHAPVKVGTVTMTLPANSVGGGFFPNLSPVDIPAPISGMTTTHLTVDYVAGSEPGMTTVEFALDGGKFCNCIHQHGAALTR